MKSIVEAQAKAARQIAVDQVATFMVVEKRSADKHGRGNRIPSDVFQSKILPYLVDKVCHRTPQSDRELFSEEESSDSDSESDSEFEITRGGYFNLNKKRKRTAQRAHATMHEFLQNRRYEQIRELRVSRSDLREGIETRAVESLDELLKENKVEHIAMEKARGNVMKVADRTQNRWESEFIPLDDFLGEDFSFYPDDEQRQSRHGWTDRDRAEFKRYNNFVGGDPGGEVMFYSQYYSHPDIEASLKKLWRERMAKKLMMRHKIALSRMRRENEEEDYTGEDEDRDLEWLWRESILFESDEDGDFRGLITHTHRHSVGRRGNWKVGTGVVGQYVLGRVERKSEAPPQAGVGSSSSAVELGGGGKAVDKEKSTSENVRGNEN